MITKSMKFLLALMLMSPLLLLAEEAAVDYDYASRGTRWLESENIDVKFKVLVEASNLGGGEVEVAEIFIPPNYEGAAHVHGLEIFYILEGELHHIVNGEMNVLTPGMIGIVRAPDKVIHKVPASGMRALLIWPGGGEIGPIAEAWTVRPIETEDLKNQ